jgi:hypothetical protein
LISQLLVALQIKNAGIAKSPRGAHHKKCRDCKGAQEKLTIIMMQGFAKCAREGSQGLWILLPYLGRKTEFAVKDCLG